MSLGPSQARSLVRIAVHAGSREDLRPLFELADDSAAQLDSYIDTGRVLIARVGDGDIVGHIQIVATGHSQELEIKNMAVREPYRGQGIGRDLVRAALQLAWAESATRVLVATAAASTGNLRFYQRLGFRMHSVERDAFTPVTGYPTPVHIDGIPLRDRIWLDQHPGPVTGRQAVASTW